MLSSADRCVTDEDWNYELVRPPDDDDYDQVVEVGRPSIVLNRDERIVHVAFIEFDDYRGGGSYTTIDHGALYWYRKEYGSCGF